MNTTKKPSIVIVGPQGCGKSRYAQQLLNMFGLVRIHDADTPEKVPREDALILCNMVPRGAAGLRVIQFHDIAGVVHEAAGGAKS